MTARLVGKLISGLRRRVALLVSRGVVQRVDDAPKCQQVQVTALAGEVLDELEHFQSYGLSAHAPVGSECLVISLGGDRARSIIIAVGDRRVRLTGLEAGEVALYDDQGTAVVLRRGRRVEVLADEVRLGSEDATDAIALAPAVEQQLQQLQTHFSALEAVLSGPPIPEPGMGAPSALQAALGAVLASSPYPSPGSVGSAKVKSE